jgi:glycosyltransferase involved in cell wall biosynthesis
VSALTHGYRGAVYLVADYPWPATSGGRVRVASIAAILGNLGPLTVLALDSVDADERWIAAIGRHRARRASTPQRLMDLAGGVVTGRHVALQRAFKADLPRAFGQVLSVVRPSVVILGYPFLGRFVDEAHKASACVIADAGESLERVSRSVLGSRGAVRHRARAMADLLSVGRMERADLPRFDQVWASSEIERKALEAAAGPTPVRVVPNAILSVTPLDGPPGPVREIGFVGWFAHPPNEAAALELITSIMPAIRIAGGPRQLTLIGRDPTSRMRQAASRDPEVVITGSVDDPKVQLRHAGVLVMPVRSGGGTRTKALEAIAAGVPVISTAFGVEGLDLDPGRDVLLAETPQEFAVAVRHVQSNDNSRQDLVTNAWRAVNERLSGPALRRAIEAALAECASGPRRQD